MNTESTINVLPFGGCTLNNPLLNLSKRKLVAPIFKRMGFERTPYSLSPRGIMQLLRFISGDLTIPQDIRKLIYVDTHVPVGDQSSVLSSTDLILIEISTLFEISLDGFILNQNRLEEFLLTAIDQTNPELKKAASRWRGALVKQKDSVRDENAEILLKNLDTNAASVAVVRNLLENSKCVKAEKNIILNGITELQKNTLAPLAIVLHNFHYMPDGRPVIWPPDLNEQIKDIASSLGIPTFDPANIVREHGTAKALAEDLRHWNSDFYPVIANSLFTFMKDVVGTEQRPLKVG